MGVGENFGEAFAKAQLSAGMPLAERGRVFLSVNDRHKLLAIDVARRFVDFGFELVATRGTAAALDAAGLPCKRVLKVNEGRPNVIDLIKQRDVQLIIYTPAGAQSFSDERIIRGTALTYGIPCITTISAARAAAEAMASRRRDPIRVWSLQEIHQGERTAAR
jgi:carbamoyl-phosphate synthase large subunit